MIEPGLRLWSSEPIDQERRAAQSEKYRFEITLHQPSLDCVKNRPLHIYGTLKNLSDSDWDLTAADRNPLRLGAKVFAERYGGPVAAEERAIIGANNLARGKTAPIRVTISTRALAAGPYVLELDLVREGSFWFGERGGRPYLHEFRVSEAAASRDSFWSSCLQWPWGKSTSLHETVRDELGFLSEIVTEFDFSGSDLLQRIRDPDSGMDPRRRTAGPAMDDLGEPAVMRTFNSRVALRNDTGIPITRFMLHLRSALRQDQRWLLDTTTSQFEFAKWYVEEATVSCPCAPPVSIELAAFLNADAYPTWLRPLRLSRLMFANLDQMPPEVELKSERSLGELAWWWATKFAADRHLDASLVPTFAMSILSEPDGLSSPAHTGPLPPRLSRFFRRLHQSDPELKARYELDDPVARSAFALDSLINSLGDPLRSPLLGEATRSWFKRRVEDHAEALTRLELLLAAYADFDEKSVAADAFPWRSRTIKSWFRDVACAVEPGLLGFASAAPRTNSKGSRVGGQRHALYLVGLPQSETGLGLKLRMTARALAKLGIHPWTIDMQEPHWKAAPKTRRAKALRLQNTVELLRDVTILHVNADLIPQALARLPHRRVLESLKIGFLLWELEEIPAAHRLALDVLDEVWVPTRFVERIYARQTAKPVVMIGAWVDLPPNISPADLPRLGIPTDSFKFFMSFDFHSSVERKNPLAAVRAFQKAFPPGERNVTLVIKANSWSHNHWGDRYDQWARLQAASAQDPRIVLVEEMFSFDDYIGLIAACDCVVSPHRSEGFGYLPAYGMLLEKPVIVTDYSGTTDFCNEQTSYPVQWKRQQLQLGDFIFDTPDAFWADIDVDHLASQMRAVIEHPDTARERAQAGQKFIRERYNGEIFVAAYRERLGKVGALVKPAGTRHETARLPTKGSSGRKIRTLSRRNAPRKLGSPRFAEPKSNQSSSSPAEGK